MADNALKKVKKILDWETDVDLEWTGLSTKEIQSIRQTSLNPLASLSEFERANPGLREFFLFNQPDYLWAPAKFLLNVEMVPFQQVIMETLWRYRFPILIASRGGSKALSPNELVRVQNGWSKIKDLNVGDQVYSSSGKLCNVTSTTDLMRDLHFYRITLRDGRTIEACEDHLWKVWDKNKNKPKNSNKYTNITTKELFDTYFWERIGQKSAGIEYRYAIPIASCLQNEDTEILDLHPYVLGVLLGDGCTRGSMISITSADPALVDRFNSLLPEGYYARKVPSSQYQYNIIRLHNNVPSFKKLCKKIGIDNLKSENKSVPDAYKYASEENRLELLYGLNDTDGTQDKRHCCFTSVSTALVQDVADIARSLGIATRIGGPYKSYCNGKRHRDAYNVSFYTDKDVFALKRKLSYHVKSKQGQSKYTKSFITNIEYIGKKDGMCITVDSEDSTYITKDYIVTHNSYSLALFSMLKALLVPGSRIVVVGAAFRQSKVIFDYCTTIWSNAPVLRSIFKSDADGPRISTDRCYLKLGSSIIYALPIGDGQKIRGMRAGTVISDEFASMSPEIYETVIAGFAAVSQDPVQNIKRVARNKARARRNEIVEADSPHTIRNQSILSGTCDYDFGHFADYFKQYKKIIQSGGDKKKLEEIFGEGETPRGFNYKDYAVIRIPYELLPEGMMDEQIVARAKMTVNSSVYLREYGACFTEDTLILTDDGAKPIAAIRKGDRVLTHKGRFRKVKALKHRFYQGIIFKYKTVGYNQEIRVTTDHPFWTPGDNWQYLDEMDKTYQVNLQSVPTEEEEEDAKFFFDHGFEDGQKSKQIGKIFNLFNNDHYLKGFLTAVFDPVKYHQRIRIRSYTYEYVTQLKTALSYIGVVCSINEVKQGNNNMIVLEIKGAGLKRLQSELFGISGYPSFNRKMSNNGKYSVFNIESRKEENFAGYVYNLEVEEDHSYSLINATVHNCFAKDSTGFFKRTLIEKCTAKYNKPIKLGDREICFDVTIKGNPDYNYVIGIDPASESDNCAMSVLELREDHTRVVYGWSTNKEDHRARLTSGTTKESNYYQFCARKIREIMKVFNIAEIGIDAQGGGIAIAEALHDQEKLELGEQPIYEVIEDDKEKEFDDMPGLHILRMIQFASAEWTSGSNHGMRKDMENTALIFPAINPVLLGIDAENQADLAERFEITNKGKIFTPLDTVEDATIEIEELKNELCTIVVTRTPSGRERWDTPEIKLEGNKKGRLRKDRYSALLIANSVARTIHRTIAPAQYQIVGGVVGLISSKQKDAQQSKRMYNGPEWYNIQEGAFGHVKRN